MKEIEPLRVDELVSVPDYHWWKRHAWRWLVGFSIVVVLLAWLVPSIQAAREAARRSQCVCNLCAVKLALHNYHSTWNTFPPSITVDAEGRPLYSWRVLILPYMEQTPLYNQFNLSAPWDSPTNLRLLDQTPRCFVCPSRHPDPSVPTALTSYVAIVGPGTIFPGANRAARLEDVTDGTANTLMVLEASNIKVPWTAPLDLDIRFMSLRVNDPDRPSLSSPHPGGANVVFVDGRTIFLKEKIAPRDLKALLTISGGEVVDANAY